MPRNARLRFDTSADRTTDKGPSRLRQARLKGAGWVREVDNPTPTLALPPQRTAAPWGICPRCKRYGRFAGWLHDDACIVCRKPPRRKR